MVSSCDHASHALQERAARAGLRILRMLQVEGEVSLTKEIIRFISGEVVRANFTHINIIDL